MTRPTPTGPRGADPSSDLRARLAPLLARATVALRDPETRAKALAAGRQANDVLQGWRAQRASQAPDDDRVAFRVIQKRLQRRESNVREGLHELIGGDGDLADELNPVLAALDGVARALAVAETLPLRSRRKAHRAVADVLDRLEDELLQASLGLVGPSHRSIDGGPDSD